MLMWYGGEAGRAAQTDSTVRFLKGSEERGEGACPWNATGCMAKVEGKGQEVKPDAPVRLGRIPGMLESLVFAVRVARKSQNSLKKALSFLSISYRPH